MDVGCSLIDKHNQTLHDKPYMSFRCVDASHEPLPQGYDLILSRDSLQHLPMVDAYAFLHNVVNSGAKYLLVGSYLHRERNENLDHAAEDSGSVTAYAVNLLQAPFLVQPAPLETMDEQDSGPPPGTKGLLLLNATQLNWAESLDMWLVHCGLPAWHGGVCHSNRAWYTATAVRGARLFPKHVYTSYDSCAVCSGSFWWSL